MSSYFLPVKISVPMRWTCAEEELMWVVKTLLQPDGGGGHWHLQGVVQSILILAQYTSPWSSHTVRGRLRATSHCTEKHYTTWPLNTHVPNHLGHLKNGNVNVPKPPHRGNAYTRTHDWSIYLQTQPFRVAPSGRTIERKLTNCRHVRTRAWHNPN